MASFNFMSYGGFWCWCWCWSPGFQAQPSAGAIPAKIFQGQRNSCKSHLIEKRLTPPTGIWWEWGAPAPPSSSLLLTTPSPSPTPSICHIWNIFGESDFVHLKVLVKRPPYQQPTHNHNLDQVFPKNLSSAFFSPKLLIHTPLEPLPPNPCLASLIID